MTTTINLAGLILTTVFACGAAVACNWLALRATFRLMQPATGRRSVPRTQTVPGRRAA